MSVRRNRRCFLALGNIIVDFTIAYAAVNICTPKHSRTVIQYSSSCTIVTVYAFNILFVKVFKVGTFYGGLHSAFAFGRRRFAAFGTRTYGGYIIGCAIARSKQSTNANNTNYFQKFHRALLK